MLVNDPAEFAKKGVYPLVISVTRDNKQPERSQSRENEPRTVSDSKVVSCNFFVSSQL